MPNIYETVRDDRNALEGAIMELVMDFTRKHGVTVTSVDLITHSSVSYGGDRADVFYGGVRVKVEV